MVKVALAHDYLTQRGGAERAVLEMAKAFPGAPIYTSLYDPSGTFDEFRELDIRTPALNRVSLFRSSHRLALLFLAPTVSSVKIDADIVLCSSTGWAHGNRCRGRKVVYCHNPARWLYQTDEYIQGKPRWMRMAMSPLFALLRKWDKRAAATADLYVANSSVVADRIEKAYGRTAEVIHAGSNLSADGPQDASEGVNDTFVLAVARLLHYKNVSALVDAVSTIDGVQLVVVGSGPDAAEIEAGAEGTDTLFLTNRSDAQMRWLYENCQALMSASHEDFGLTPVEAAMFGRPAVVWRKAGFLETVVEGETGEFFDEPVTDQIVAALRRALERDWNRAMIRSHADKFSAERFRTQLQAVVERVLATP